MCGISCRVAEGPGDMELAMGIRREVFVREQGVPEDIEMDGLDSRAVHVLAYLDGRVAGTGRVVRTPEGMKLGRIAVLREFRGRGVGRALTMYLISEARKLGPGPIYGNAQVSARGFYEGLGFRAVGGEFMEAGIRHVRMVWQPGE